MEILQSKLRKPIRRGTLHRKRLVRAFRDIRHKKLAAVTAGAGYGKTTLVLDVSNHLDVASAWYRMDEQDADFHVFLNYLYAAIAECTHGTAKRWIPRSTGTGMKKQSDLLLEWLAFTEASITGPTLLILDDVHLAGHSREINAAIDFILERLPADLHLILVSRKNLGIKQSSLRAKEQLIEISEADLSFRDHEIEQFFHADVRDAGVRTDDILSRTGGWAAGLVLLRYTLKRQPADAVSGCLASFQQAPRFIFAYLKENIFDAQPASIQNFMMKAALLPEIDIRFCQDVFDEKNAGTFLKQMIDDHLMIFPVDETGTVFYLHHLFRDFLLDRLYNTWPAENIAALHIRIARKTEGRDIFLALTHYIDGHAFEDAVRIFKEHEMKFLLEGKINFLDQCLQKIPNGIIEKNPQLLLVQAKLFTYFGAPAKARDLIIRAHLLFKKQGAREEMVACLVELGTQYYFTGYVKEAKLLLEQVVDDIRPQSITYVIAMTYLTFLSSVLGEFDTADRYYDAAMAEITDYPEFDQKASAALLNTSLTHILHFKGDFKGSYDLSSKLLTSVLKLKIVPCLPLIYYQLSVDCYFLGDFEKGCTFARKGVASCERAALNDSRKAWNYLAWAQNCLGRGKLDQASGLIDRSAELFEHPGNRWGLANAWECRHRLYIARGNLPKARKILDNALDLIRGYGLDITRGILENACAALLMDLDKDRDALDCLKLSRPRLTGIGYHLFTNHLLTSKALVRLDRRKEAVTHLARAVSLSLENAYDRFIRLEVNWLVPFLKNTCFKRSSFAIPEKQRIYLETLLAPDLKLGLTPDPDPPVLELRLLGPFAVTAGDRPIPVSNFKSTKALTILKYLAAHRQRGFIPKEELIELLWPDEDPNRTGSRFNMAMSALRKTLEPDLPPKAPSAYVERKKDTYRLYGDRRIRIDAEQFSAAIDTMLKPSPSQHGPDALAAAEHLYNGPFLAEDPYHDWCMDKRQLFSQSHQDLLKAIADAYENQGDVKNAILYTRKSVAADPFDETAFKKLMLLCGRAGDTPGVAKAFHACRKAMAQIDCPVSPEIKALYEQLTGSHNGLDRESIFD